MVSGSPATISIDDLDSPELTFCKTLADEAGKIMLEYFDADQHEQTKADGTPVTIADTTINSMVIERIKAQYPDDEIVGEEQSTANYGTGRRWICDPIDGTMAFVVGVPISTFSIALIIDGKPELGLIYEPQHNRMYFALRNRGSYCNGKKLQVSNYNFENGMIGLAPDYIKGDLVNLLFMKKLLKFQKRLSIFDGAALRGCLIAAGRLAGHPHPNVKPYDIAAAHLIVEEAGGKVTDTKGDPLDYSKDFRGAILSNGVAHDALLDLFKS